ATAPPIAGVAPRSTIAKIEYDDEDPAEHDPDDPDDDTDDDPIDDDADDELEEADGEPEALDDEERAWHRVWADEPRAGPAAAAPVRLSFVSSGVELVRRRKHAWAALPWIDRAVADGKDPSNAVAFGALLAPYLPDELRGGELGSAVQELAHPMIV